MFRLPGLEPNADTWVRVAASARGARAVVPRRAAPRPRTAVSATHTRAGMRRVRCSMVPPLERPCGGHGFGRTPVPTPYGQCDLNNMCLVWRLRRHDP